MDLNKEQQRAVDSNSELILCLAGAGAGKTRVAISRISRLVKDGVAPSSILALTFTNAAAAKMKERYARDHLGEEIPEFRTFHAFCYSILCKDPAIREALGYENIPGIASEEQEKLISERAKAQCKITLSNDKLIHRDHLSIQEQFQTELYDKAVNKLMRSENLITFDKLNHEVAELFANNHPATEVYKEKYKYIAADEFQDTDADQIKFLNSFTKSNFYFCGDCLQNIYSFRGTSNEFIKLLSTADNWEKIKLFTNYRSTNQICDYANKFSAKYADPSYRIEMKGTRDGERVVTKLVNGPKGYSAINPDDLDDVTHELSKLHGSSAILCRTNKEIAAVSAYLTNHGIDFITSKEVGLQKLIDCALSDEYTLGLFASYLNSNKYGEYIRLSATVKNPDLVWFLKLYGNVTQIKDDMKIINKLRSIAGSFGSTNSKLEEVAELLHLKSIKRADKEYLGIEFLKYLKAVISEVKSSELYVGTIHSVKGLEYDNVFVMNVGSYCFRLDSEEHKNLFYVAITRAKNRLFVYELFND